ncbi:NAD-dependent epimerase/dehydratase family protein [Mycolicibacterium sp.]|uniref:NAD-dependent epimerase/dehydratase family protein n=1 Tax=Mycolicibacterium sp. TaxID=2320850 RepID=UPI001A320096|nr:NAD-dependent epimerase/dehydratase family protein [Mycolicibacterium sp.]MBJ7337654.1 GDP-mannose 4,6-dehydratase [Mycolicibacterium sp.]
MARSLVTGAAGFIGSNLVDRLLADGHEVVGIDNLSTGHVDNLASAWQVERSHPGRFRFHHLDVTAPELTDVVLGSNPDVIFHLAAQIDVRVSVRDPLFDARSNVLGTINLCEASREAGVQKIVYAASGGSRYGTPSALPVGEGALANPLSPYAVAKFAGETYLRAYAGMYGVTPICLALSNVYGPRQSIRGEAGVIAVFGSSMVAGREVTIYGDGTATRDYVYVDDVVEAFVLAAASNAETAELYNVGTGRQTSVLELHRLMAAMFDDAADPVYKPARTGELQAIALDAGKAARELGWMPAAGLEEGIAHTVEWLRSVSVSDPLAAVSA